MCPTLLGRLQTRLAMAVLPALVAVAVLGLGGNGRWLALVGLWLVLGALLDAGVYRPLVRWQPGMLTLAMGVGEGLVLVAAAQATHLGLGAASIAAAYAGGWVAAQAVRVAVLPVVWVTRQEQGGEIGPPRWWIPAGQHVRPAMPDHGAPLPAQLSGAWARAADDVRPLPAPSDVGPMPDEFLAALDALRGRPGRG